MCVCVHAHTRSRLFWRNNSLRQYLKYSFKHRIFSVILASFKVWLFLKPALKVHSHFYHYVSQSVWIFHLILNCGNCFLVCKFWVFVVIHVCICRDLSTMSKLLLSDDTQVKEIGFACHVLSACSSYITLPILITANPI